MSVLPPGTLLQHLYLKERLRLVEPGRFIEIGPGRGDITRLLLDGGWTGAVHDLSAATIELMERRFPGEIAAGRLVANTGDFVQSSDTCGHFDLIISCMVMEHMDDDMESRFMAVSAARLGPGGMMIGLVPASAHHWGIEDEISGHLRRYERGTLAALMERTGWRLRHVAGLTFPLSNALLPLSNLLTRQAESDRLTMPMQERTMLSGRRTVRFKTVFPPALGLVLNDAVMRPWHWLQKRFVDSDRAMVLYFEAEPYGGTAAAR